jgi:two-component system response regulator RegA
VHLETIRYPISGSSDPSSAAQDATGERWRQPRLLLIDSSPAARGFLQRLLTAQGFNVCAVQTVAELDNDRPPQDNEAAASNPPRFDHAVIGFRHQDGDGLHLIRRLRVWSPDMRIIVVTDVDRFATAIRVVRAGADDYLPTPIDELYLIAALTGRTPALPPVPKTPLGLNRTCWEHVMRIFEQCDRNVTHAAQRLGMHRRSLQRFLGKRALQPRAISGGMG